MLGAMDETACRLEALLGHRVRCDGEPCPFWRAADGCVFDDAGPELAGRPEVAALLL